MTDHYYSGISGLALPIPKYQFPEAFRHSSRLTYYSTLFNSIEINRSFYEVPKGKTMMKWSNEVGEHFRFTFKLWKEITHVKELLFKEKDVKQFIDAINEVGDKKGALLIQFPPGLKSHNAQELNRLLSSIRNLDNEEWKLVVEFRDKGWYSEEVAYLLTLYNASWVLHDKGPGKIAEITSNDNPIYVRFHGPNGDYRGSYTEDFLREYAEQIRSWLKENNTVYVYFNNTMGEAFKNLLQLNDYVKE